MGININQSAYYFFLCLEFVLFKRTFCVDEIITYLENKYNIFLFKETILKYIRTLKTLGFEFERVNNKMYKLKEVPFKITAGINEEKIILEIIEALRNYHVSNSGYDKYNFLEKLQFFLPKDLKKIFNRRLILLNYLEHKNNYMLKNIKKYCKDAQRLNITYLKDGKIKQKDLVEPADIFFTKKSIYLKCFDLNQKTNILINFDWILEIVQTPLKNKYLFKKQFVTLKFSSKFAKAYTLKEGEEIIKKGLGELYVRSFYYDKTLFFKNILRYMESCEIVSPENLRKDFQKYVKDLYQIYYCYE